ncbi:hypothetical protein GW17_00054931 [Ensete ventricosum]|nr:hypothetical protein GW17_00054931 [Ensete ventricosum]
MSDHLAVIVARELPLFQRTTATLPPLNPPAQTYTTRQQIPVLLCAAPRRCLHAAAAGVAPLLLGPNTKHLRPPIVRTAPSRRTRGRTRFAQEPSSCPKTSTIAGDAHSGYDSSGHDEVGGGGRVTGGGPVPASTTPNDDVGHSWRVTKKIALGLHCRPSSRHRSLAALNSIATYVRVYASACYSCVDVNGWLRGLALPMTYH